eukprot:CAMPEP_0178895606 /NCGR_PEP_ID=MMETSP0786-20121207/685_1 /TAXON_ID=186022 /ORGANISM="Thalassionema frauenfeldii, Strain CCMP 1798" /LENGTH=1224 /DNA_ID=CAMNT_0020565865 /DNA_START=73 /DNA_END=3748 /DNA_ORIENTATION=+
MSYTSSTYESESSYSLKKECALSYEDKEFSESERSNSLKKEQFHESFSSSSVSSESQPSSLSMTYFSDDKSEIQSNDDRESFKDEEDLDDILNAKKPTTQRDQTSFPSRHLSASKESSFKNERSNALSDSQSQSNFSQPRSLRSNALSNPQRSAASLSNARSFHSQQSPPAQLFQTETLNPTNSAIQLSSNFEQFVDEEAHECIPILDNEENNSQRHVCWNSDTVSEKVQMAQESFIDEDALLKSKSKFKRKGFSKKKRALCALMFSFFLLGGMIGLIVYLYNAGFGNKRNVDLLPLSLAPTITPNSAEQYEIILPPPDNLNIACSRENFLSAIILCPIQCRKSECCYIPNGEVLNGQESCRNTNKNICERYSPSCDLLYGPLLSDNITSNSTDLTVRIPSAPTDLLSLCNDGEVEACLNACFDGYCCFSAALDILAGFDATGPSCYERQQCEGYYPCLMSIMTFLPSNSRDPLPQAPDTLGKSCSEGSLTSQAGAVIVFTIAAKALCCFDTSCAAANLKACATYSPCIIIFKSMLGEPTNSPTSDILAGITNNTENIEQESTALPSPPSDLSDLCNFNSTERTIDKIQKCALACEPGLCCLPGAENSCLMDQLFVCLEYTPCQILETFLEPTGDYFISEPIFDLDLVCTPVSLSTEAGRVACIQGCYAGLCCTSPSESCAMQNIFRCLKYRSCERIVDPENGGFKGIVPLFNVSESNRTNKTIQPPSSSDIGDECAIEKLSDDEGIAECHDICLEADCCTTEVGNCYHFNTDVCNLYGDCTNLFIVELDSPTESPNADNEPPPNDLPILCSEDDEIFSPECFTLCEKALCCFDKENSCVDENQEWCFLYAPCKVLETKSEIERACAAGATIECKLLCNEGSCCFPKKSNNTSRTSCENNIDFCMYYQTCSVIYQDESHEDIASNSLSEICNDKKFYNNNTSEWEKCNEACEEASCCFLDLSRNESCQENVEFCAEFRPCKVLFNTTGEAGLSTDGHSIEACAPETVESSATAFLICKLACLEAECCFLPQDGVGSCIDNITFCERFADCHIVYEKQKTPAPSTMSTDAALPFIDPSMAIEDPEMLTSDLSMHLQDLSISIDLLCNNLTITSSNGKTTCLSLCRPGGCCFLGPPSVKSCKENFEFCRQYQACSVLFDASNTSSVEVIKHSEIETACTAESNSSARNSECEELCAEGACCYLDESSSGSCRENVDFCSYYSVCEN